MLAALLLSLPVLALGPVFTDRWVPFEDETHASDSGEFAVTIRRNGQGVKFTLLQRSPATSEETVLAEGELDHLPTEVLVSDTGIGLAAVGTYYKMGAGNSITTVDAKGKTTHALPLKDLFTPEEMERLPRTVSNIWWYDDAWIDEGTGEVIVTSGGRNIFTGKKKSGPIKVFAVSFGPNGLRHGGYDDVLRALHCVPSTACPPLRE